MLFVSGSLWGRTNNLDRHAHLLYIQADSFAVCNEVAQDVLRQAPARHAQYCELARRLGQQCTHLHVCDKRDLGAVPASPLTLNVLV